MVLVSEKFLIEAEKTKAERDTYKAQNELKDQQLAAKDEKIRALEILDGIRKESIKSWTEAAMERKTALTSDDKAFKLMEADNLRVRGERDAARRANKAWGLGGLVIGLTLGILSQRK